ncbi:MAG: hypothetical protein AB7E60_13945 [Sphingobium sp.]
MHHSRPMPLLCCAAMTMALLGGCAGGTDDGPMANNMTGPSPQTEAIDDSDTLGNSVGADENRLPTDDWVGRWDGPEGLFLDIQPAPDGKRGHYAITNMDMLDRQDDYVGIAEGPHIRFVREGKDLSIRAGNGAETGFRYLEGKTDCLIVIPDQEGYCR